MSKPVRFLSILSKPCFRTRPTIRAFSSTRSRPSFLRQHGVVNVQQVQFRQDRTGWVFRLAFKTVLVFALGWTVLEYLDIDLEELEEEEKDAQDNGKDETEGKDDIVPDKMPEGATFIPLSFYRQRPREVYDGSSPEWQSFLELRKNRKREEATKEALAANITRICSSNIQFQFQLGKPITLQDYDFDILFPQGPPPEFERSGLEIADEYVAWTTRPVSNQQMGRRQSVLMPWPMAKSFWASYKAFFGLQLANLKQRLNSKSSTNGSQQAPPSSLFPLDQVNGKGVQQEPQAPPSMDKMIDPKTNEIVGTRAKSSTTSPDSSKILNSLPAIPKLGGDMGAAVMAFKRTLARNWHRQPLDPPRGTVLVFGLVRVKGTKGTGVIDVRAAYHPRDVSLTILDARLRYLIPRNQRPPNRQSGR